MAAHGFAHPVVVEMGDAQDPRAAEARAAGAAAVFDAPGDLIADVLRQCPPQAGQRTSG